MKRIILLALIALPFASCKKCYTCTTVITITGNGSSYGSHEFCGTPSQKKNHEKEGTSTTTAHSGNVTVTQTTKTGCK